MSEENRHIRIVAVAGSVRPGNSTGKAMALVVDELAKQADVAVELISKSRSSNRKETAWWRSRKRVITNPGKC